MKRPEAGARLTSYAFAVIRRAGIGLRRPRPREHMVIAWCTFVHYDATWHKPT